MNPMRLALFSVSVGLGLAPLACTPSDVVAKVGSRRIHRVDVDLHRRTTGATAEATVETLITRELLVEAALDGDLEKRPEVAARLASAEREILAQAYLDSALSNLDDTVLLKRYEASKDALTYRQVRLAHIFIAAPPSTDADTTQRAESKANSLWARLLGGDDFATLAAHDSEDSATAARGGDLGLLREGSVDAALFEAGAALGLGAVSKPIRTAYGFHLLKALGPMERITPTFAEVRAQLLARLRQERQAALLEQLQRDITVTRRPQALQEAAQP